MLRLNVLVKAVRLKRGADREPHITQGAEPCARHLGVWQRFLATAILAMLAASQHNYQIKRGIVELRPRWSFRFGVLPENFLVKFLGKHCPLAGHVAPRSPTSVCFATRTCCCRLLPLPPAFHAFPTNWKTRIEVEGIQQLCLQPQPIRFVETTTQQPSLAS